MRESVDSFLNHLVVEKGFSRNTLDAYRNDLYQFTEYLGGSRNSSNSGKSGPMAMEPDQRWSEVNLGLLTDYVLESTRQEELSRHYNRTESGGPEVFL